MRASHPQKSWECKNDKVADGQLFRHSLTQIIYMREPLGMALESAARDGGIRRGWQAMDRLSARLHTVKLKKRVGVVGCTTAPRLIQPSCGCGKCIPALAVALKHVVA